MEDSRLSDVVKMELAIEMSLWHIYAGLGIAILAGTMAMFDSSVSDLSKTNVTVQ